MEPDAEPKAGLHGPKGGLGVGKVVVNGVVAEGAQLMEGGTDRAVQVPFAVERLQTIDLAVTLDPDAPTTHEIRRKDLTELTGLEQRHIRVCVYGCFSGSAVGN